MHDEAYQRAAIIVGSLDQAAADELLARLPERQSLAIRNAMLASSDSSDTERDHTIEAFLGIRPVQAPGLDRSDWSSPNVAPPQAADASTSSFQELLSQEDHLIAASIVYERTSVVAALLNALPRKRAAGVLCRLPHEVQSRAVEALDLGVHARSEFIDVIADVICDMHADASRSTALTTKHQDALQAIFDELTPAEREQMLQDIARENPLLAQRLKHHGQAQSDDRADCYC